MENYQERICKIRQVHYSLKQFKYIAVVCLVLTIGSITWGADPLGMSFGVRPLALGNAYVGLANDGSAIFINSAGLAGLKKLALTSMYTQSDGDTTFTSLGGAWANIYAGSAGAGYRNRIVSNVQASNETVNVTTQDLTIFYTKYIRPDLSLGADIRYISRAMSKDVSGYESFNAAGGAINLGAKYSPLAFLDIGFAIRNIAGRMVKRTGGIEKLAVRNILGISMHLGGENGYIKEWHDDVLLNCDLSKGEDEPIPQIHAGVEWLPINIFAVRAGLDQTPKSGSENYNNLTAGFGLNYNGITFDYTLYRQEAPPQSITNYFSIGYLTPKKEQEKPKRKKPEILHFSDVPPGYWAKKPIETLTSLGLLDYYKDGSFKPERPITRAEAIMFLIRAKEYPLPKGKERRQVFSDVPIDFWAADYIQVGWEKKITFGYPDGTFRPRKETTRAEEAALLYRVDGLSLQEVLKKTKIDMPEKHWAINEVLGAQEAGLFDYLKDKPFVPNRSITRAELAETLYRTKLIQAQLKEIGLISTEEAQ